MKKSARRYDGDLYCPDCYHTPLEVLGDGYYFCDKCGHQPHINELDTSGKNMRRASSVLRNLEIRIARLEKRSGRSQGIAMADQIRKEILDDLPYLKDNQRHLELTLSVQAGRLKGKLIDLVLEKIRNQLSQIEEKTKKERAILNRLAPNQFSFGYMGKMYQEIRPSDSEVWGKHRVFLLIDDFIEDVDDFGVDPDEAEVMTNELLDEVVKACRELGI